MSEFSLRRRNRLTQSGLFDRLLGSAARQVVSEIKADVERDLHPPHPSSREENLQERIRLAQESHRDLLSRRRVQFANVDKSREEIEGKISALKSEVQTLPDAQSKHQSAFRELSEQRSRLMSIRSEISRLSGEAHELMKSGNVEAAHDRTLKVQKLESQENSLEEELQIRDKEVKDLSSRVNDLQRKKGMLEEEQAKLNMIQKRRQQIIRSVNETTRDFIRRMDRLRLREIGRPH